MNRHGVTLVELVVGLPIAVMLAVALWAGLFADLRRFHVDHARLDGLQGALLLDEMLSRDLARVVRPLPDPQAPGGPVLVGDGGSSLTFPIATESGAPPAPEAVETVRYVVDAAARVVTRTHGGRSEKVPGLFGAELEFAMADVRIASGAAPLRVLKYRLTCARSAGEALGAAADAARITVVGAVPVPHLALQAQHAYWNPLTHDAPASEGSSR